MPPLRPLVAAPAAVTVALARVALVAAFAATTIAPAAAQDWTALSIATTEDIRAIEQGSFSDRWLAGTGGLVAVSDAGRTVWTPESAGSTADFLSVQRPTSTQIWVGGAAGTVRVKNVGTWFNRNIPDASQDYVLASGGSGAARAFGSAGVPYCTVDVGLNWSQETSGVSVALHGGTGFSSGPAWAVGDEGTILHTTDGGATWAPQASGTTADLHRFLQGPAGWIFAFGEAGTILRSTDQGATWTAIASGTAATLHAASTSKQNSNWMLAVGEGGTVLKSTDAGSTWCHLNAGTSVDLFAVEAASNSEYLVGGAGGLLLRTTNGGGSCGTAVSASVAAGETGGLRIVGPFPNPARGRASVVLSAGRGASVRLDVIDVTGRRVARLSGGDLGDGGTRVVDLDATAWPAGTYWVRAEAAGFTECRRLVILR
jgi:photosystem II stability/assembly factor-like uncharacterized protein